MQGIKMLLAGTILIKLTLCVVTLARCDTKFKAPSIASIFLMLFSFTPTALIKLFSTYIFFISLKIIPVDTHVLSDVNALHYDSCEIKDYSDFKNDSTVFIGL